MTFMFMTIETEWPSWLTDTGLIYMFAYVKKLFFLAGDPTEQETQTITQIWQQSLFNANLEVQR